MVSKTRRQAFLVEMLGTNQMATLSTVKIGRRKFSIEPLFSQYASVRKGSTWLVLTPKSPAEGQNPWDWAHDLASKLQSLSNEPTYVEPDIEQSVPYLNREGKKIEGDFCLQAGSECSVNEPDTNWPIPGSFAWHLEDSYSQLASARDSVGGSASAIRIGHIDTGIDPQHITVPSNINWGLSLNLLEGGTPVDPGKRGILFNPGHGTGTIGILAGNFVDVAHPHLNHVFSGYLGGCPHAEIVIVRAANSVVHLWTSSMAKSLDYVSSPGDGKNELPCDVASISMGGLPSRAWAAAVNRCYEAGTLVVCAAGNNFGGLPLRTLVWPARFSRTIAVTGATADKTPYFKKGIHFRMQSCYGPASAMGHAIAAYSPNIAWPELGCANTIDLDGAGTSSATPQVAAAAALWLAKYKDKVGSGWRKVEAVRHALYSSADKSLPESQKYYGNGVLKALDALSVKPLAAKKLVQAPDADVKFPLFAQLSGWDDLERARAAMYECEAAQLYASTAKLQDLYPELEDGITGDASLEDVVSTMCDLPNISHTLRGFLLASINN